MCNVWFVPVLDWQDCFEALVFLQLKHIDSFSLRFKKQLDSGQLNWLSWLDPGAFVQDYRCCFLHCSSLQSSHLALDCSFRTLELLPCLNLSLLKWLTGQLCVFLCFTRNFRKVLNLSVEVQLKSCFAFVEYQSKDLTWKLNLLNYHSWCLIEGIWSTFRPLSQQAKDCALHCDLDVVDFILMVFCVSHVFLATY